MRPAGVAPGEALSEANLLPARVMLRPPGSGVEPWISVPVQQLVNVSKDRKIVVYVDGFREIRVKAANETSVLGSPRSLTGRIVVHHPPVIAVLGVRGLDVGQRQRQAAGAPTLAAATHNSANIALEVSAMRDPDRPS